MFKVITGLGYLPKSDCCVGGVITSSVSLSLSLNLFNGKLAGGSFSDLRSSNRYLYLNEIAKGYFMSVSILSSVEISMMARFAEAHGVGEALDIATILSEQNIKTFNSRYSESVSVDFKLSYVEYNANDIYDLTKYWLSNSWEGLEGSEAAGVVVKIQRYAIFPIKGVNTFSRTVGRRVCVSSARGASDTFIANVESPYMYSLIAFDRDGKKWIEMQAMRSSCRFADDSDFLSFNLSLEQVSGLKSQLKSRRDAQIAHQQALTEKRAAERASFKEKFIAITPANSKAVIIAELHQDNCGDNDDYYGSIVKRRVVLTFSKHTRNLFPEMRKAALNFKSTEFLNQVSENAEHRENYSMGRGTYLCDGSTYSGWQIRKERIYNGTISPAELLELDYTSPVKGPSKKLAPSVEVFSLSCGSVKKDVSTNQLTFIPINPLERSEVKLLTGSGFKQVPTSDGWIGAHTKEATEAISALISRGHCGLF